MKKSFIAAVLIAAFVFASCEQSVLTGALPYGNAAVNESLSASNIAPQVVPPTSWGQFNPLPFSGNVPAVRGLATDGTYLVAVGNDSSLGQVASRYDTVSGQWTKPAALAGITAGNPGLAHYLYKFFLVTVANGASATGSYSPDGLTWTTTGNIGFGTKAAVYGPAEQFYVVAGQGGQAAYTDVLTNTFTRIPQTTTGWPASSGPAAYINAGAYGYENYVFGGGSGYIAYTPTIIDPTTGGLATWQQGRVPLSTADFINAIAYGGNSVHVAVGNLASGLGVILYSTDDGVTWTNVDLSQMRIGTVTIYTVTYGNGYFVAVDNNGYAAYSDDGITWTDSPISYVLGADALVNQAVYYKATNTYFWGGGDSSGLQLAESNQAR